MSETRIGPKKHLRAADRSFSLFRRTSLPPIKTAAFLRSAGPRVKDGAINQIADVVSDDTAMAKQMLDTGVDRDDAIEHARLRIGVKAQKDL